MASEQTKKWPEALPPTRPCSHTGGLPPRVSEEAFHAIFSTPETHAAKNAADLHSVDLLPERGFLGFLELAAFNRGTLVKNGSILHDKHDLPQGMNVREWVSADGN